MRQHVAGFLSSLSTMLEGEPALTLAKLNEATQAWVELDYHRKRHSELNATPICYAPT